MLYSDILTGNKDSDHVKAISQLGSTVSIHPNAGASAEFPALPEVHGLDGVAERFSAPRLHFHERDVVPAPHDQVDIAMPAAEAMRNELPAVASHPSCSNAFAQ